MAYNYDVEGWEDWNGNRFDGEPSDPGDVLGQFVHYYDPDNPEDQHWFWAYTIEEFEDWDDWAEYIASMIEMYAQSTS